MTGAALALAVVSTIVLVSAIFLIDVTRGTEAPDLSTAVLGPGFVACIAGWMSFICANADRAVAAALASFVAVAADAATVALVFTSA